MEAWCGLQRSLSSSSLGGLSPFCSRLGENGLLTRFYSIPFTITAKKIPIFFRLAEENGWLWKAEHEVVVMVVVVVEEEDKKEKRKEWKGVVEDEEMKGM